MDALREKIEKEDPHILKAKELLQRFNNRITMKRAAFLTLNDSSFLMNGGISI